MTERRTSAAYAAAVWAGVFAAISLYWALGGRIGIDTVGGQIEELVRSGDPAGSLLAWAAVLLKVAGVIFALALVRRWGRVFPRGLLLAAGWAATAVLLGYGGLTVGAELLVVAGMVEPPADVDWYALRWHLRCGTPTSWSGACCSASPCGTTSSTPAAAGTRRRRVGSRSRCRRPTAPSGCRRKITAALKGQR